ncbi:MAG: sulfatase-like hydrolase/transferase, partial [Planctomycetota bacterium]
MHHLRKLLSVVLLGLGWGCQLAPDAVAGEPIGPGTQPNIIVVFADDISAREFPIYGSSQWSPPGRKVDSPHSTDPAHLAKTPTFDRLAEEGCVIQTAWSATICGPSRAMIMTGRYAHLHKWWHNKDKGKSPTGHWQWLLYESSPLQLGHVAQQAGYATMWAGKTQMGTENLDRFGFDEGLFTPGESVIGQSPYTDFRIVTKKVDGERVLFN